MLQIANRAYARPAALSLSSLVAIALVIATGCGSKDTSADPIVVGGTSETVEIDGSKFEPGNLQLPVGATVTFTNRDAATHDARAEDESWSTEFLGKDDSEAVTFGQAGEWLYICTLHPHMKARITVVDAEAAGS